MEKIKDIIKPLIGILLIFSFVLAFSSCDQKATESEKNNMSVHAHDTVEVQQEKDTVSWETKVEKESERMEERYDSLKVKAQKKSKKVEEEVSQVIDRLDKERKEISEGNTSEKIEERWEKFKEKSEAVIDSLDKEI